MKKQISIFAVTAILFSALINFSSCEKDEGKLPNIAFKTGGSYVSADRNINSGDTIIVGITASKAEDKDVLKTFNISKSVNGAALTTVQTIDISSLAPDTYSADFPLATTGAANDSTRYTFTVTNRDGLINSVSLRVKIN